MLEIRNLVVMNLRRELLGPRGGVREVMSEDPASEYVTGILQPKDSTFHLFRWGRPDLQAQEVGEGEEDEFPPESEKIEPAVKMDALSLPKTVGLSFVIEATPPAAIGVCITFARYVKAGLKWKREPINPWVIHNIEIMEGRQSWSVAEHAKLHCRMTRANTGDYHISLFLVNETPLGDNERPRTQDLIFQPQIRVVLEKNARLKPLLGQRIADEEEASLALLYLNREAMARGHLCGAVWRDVDPERPWRGPGQSSSLTFEWPDGELLGDAERAIFIWPDVRTEYLPCYPVSQAEPNCIEEEFQTPEIAADELADSFEASKLSAYLMPIVEKYRAWISSRKHLLSSLPAQLRPVASTHLHDCRLSADRIEEGINLLLKDKDMRLAFCVMNKAMAVQHIWKQHKSKTKTPLKWHTFQLAFILQCIPSTVDSYHPHRNICDLLWYPTGGGKTESYLGLALFMLAFRRVRAVSKGMAYEGLGTAVLSRYTLRLLTIQQFRRALGAVTALELLRIKGWRPSGCDRQDPFLGEARFSLGLWVGGQVTPNRLMDYLGWDPVQKRQRTWYGAVGILAKNPNAAREAGEPAQVLDCPACGSLLAISNSNLTKGQHTVHLIVRGQTVRKPPERSISDSDFEVLNIKIRSLPSPGYRVVSFTFNTRRSLKPSEVDRWWDSRVAPNLGSGVKLASARASRPGYFLRRWGMAAKAIDFEIHCPNPDCELNEPEWTERMVFSGFREFNTPVLEPFRIPGTPNRSKGAPIPAYVIDDQIYAKCPSMIIATVDKFARLAFEPKAASIFGNVDSFDSVWGFFRDAVPPERGDLDAGDRIRVSGFAPPDLIIQDELHLIEGPLGSMVGIYEAAIELLCSHFDGQEVRGPKYVASSATVRHAISQVQAIFNRRVALFPPKGLSVDDNFFSHTVEVHPLDLSKPGRLYVGVCAPGVGPLSVIRNIWAILLQTVWEVGSASRSDPQVDNFWTVVGYFNAIRELAAALALSREDIRLRIEDIARRRSQAPRPWNPVPVELSSITPSEDIPGHLTKLSSVPSEVDAVFATSMFGTGVDIERLGLMIVHGQPKTTANYIQATGRVGRKVAGLVITFLRASRPRDLDHYEFFVGYHRSFGRLVEPITVYPFSPRTCERALGPVSVAVLRNARQISSALVPPEWAADDRMKKGGRLISRSGASLMKSRRYSGEVDALMHWIERRSQSQPPGIRPIPRQVEDLLRSELDRWYGEANKPDPLVYSEWTMYSNPQYNVVLGDPQHTELGLVVYENVPQSLRDVEATTAFEG
jgi:hypothetical protein